MGYSLVRLAAEELGEQEPVLLNMQPNRRDGKVDLTSMRLEELCVSYN